MKKLRTPILILLGLNLIFVFINSAVPAAVSGAASSSLASGIVTRFFSGFSAFSPERQQRLCFLTEVLLRKAAHAAEFFSLGLLMALAAEFHAGKRFIPDSLLKRMALEMALCTICAVSDELHQLFVPGRSCQVSDVLIDTAGAAAGILLAGLLCRNFRRSRRK